MVVTKKENEKGEFIMEDVTPIGHILHPKNWADSLPDLKRKDDTLANAHMDENRSWANESPYKNIGYKEESLKYGSEGLWGFHANTRLCAENVRSGITKTESNSGSETWASVDVDKHQMKSALDHQIGSSNHYKDTEIQPIEFIAKNDLSFIVGNCIKYVVRAKKKGGAEDIKKAMHYLQLELELKYGIRSEVKYQE